jgi:cardiolipin synthase (CMP-forming)
MKGRKAVPNALRTNLPNALTLLRLALAPVIAWLLLQRHDAAALTLFLVAAVSDFVDGVLARRWNQRTRFGAVADPLADKATGVLVVIVLTLQASLPLWFAAAVVARDLVIVGGLVAYRAAVGRVEMAPSMISKMNTALLFVFLLGVLGSRAGLVSAGLWLQVLQFATLATIVGSGLHYVVVWGRKAHQARGVRNGAA